MRIFGHHKDEQATDELRRQAAKEGAIAKKAIDDQFEALFRLMDETLASVSKDQKRIEHQEEEPEGACEK